MKIHVGAIFSDKSCLLFLVQGRGRRTPPQRGKLYPASMQKTGKSQELFLHLCFSITSSSKQFVCQSGVFWSNIVGSHSEPSCVQVWFLLDVQGANPSLLFPVSGGSMFFGLGPHHPRLWLCLHRASSFVCLLPYPSLTEVFVIGFRVHPNPGWSPLEMLNLITSTKTLFPNKVQLQLLDRHIFWGTTHSTHCKSV